MLIGFLIKHSILMKYYINRFKINYLKHTLTFIFLIVISASAFSQTVVVKDSAYIPGTTVVIAGTHYHRTGFHNMIFGAHHRREWNTPFRVANFYIDTALGGLTVTKESGGRQTSGLRLKAKNGKEYVLRSIDKDFGNGLADIYQGTFIGNVAKDQASIGYPGAAVTVTPMIAAAGIYHTNPRIVFLPKQAALESYNENFGDQLYLFEERPDEDQSDAAWFGNSKNVIGTEKLFEKIYEDHDNRVDQPAFAKARLFDMFIGDWSRHADQWRWASFKNGDETIYRPVPRDRDQIYTKFDGFLPFVATTIAGATFLESFSGNIKKIKGFNKPGQILDQHFTNVLTKAQWIQASVQLQNAITDSVIEYSMQQLPQPYYALKEREKITGFLKSRRDHLQDYASRYYNKMANNIAVYGSDDSELFEIDRISQNETSIKLYKIKKDGIPENVPYFSRVIFNDETKEVWLYGFKGNDVYRLTGNAGQGVKLRIIGFTKDDTWIKNIEGNDRKTKMHKGESGLYDSVFQKKIKISPIIILNPPAYKVIEKDVLYLFTRPGLHVGLNFIYRPTVWKRDADEVTHNLAFNYGFIRKTMYLNYVGIFPHAFGNWDFFLKGKYDFVAAENFYGVGNESKDSVGAAPLYYQATSRRFYAGLGIQRVIANMHQIDASLYYQDIKIDKDADSYIFDKENTLPVFTSNKFAGLVAGYNYRNVNDRLLPTKGINFLISGGYIMSVDKRNSSFLKGLSEFSFYVPLGKLFSFASRVGGGTMTGDAPYYYLNKLDGNENLRGYSRDRFYGKSSFFNNNEIRLISKTRNVVFNGRAGIFAFFDNGRVWQPGEKSSTWHYGYGGGLVLVPFEKFALMGSYGLSNDGGHITVKAEMFF